MGEKQGIGAYRQRVGGTRNHHPSRRSWLVWRTGSASLSEPGADKTPIHKEKAVPPCECTPTRAYAAQNPQFLTNSVAFETAGVRVSVYHFPTLFIAPLPAFIPLVAGGRVGDQADPPHFDPVPPCSAQTDTCFF